RGIWACQHEGMAPTKTTNQPFLKMRKFTTAGLLLIAVIALACSPVLPRPDSWAQPLSLPGAPNLFKISDDLYRSAQLDTTGMKNIKQLGIRTVINLRSFHSDQDELGSTGLAREHINMSAWHPEKEEAVRVLTIVTDSARTPVLVHCQHGSDRTGAMCAVYRVAVQGWSREEAIREMTRGGFGFHQIFANLPIWIRVMDMGQIRKEAGITVKPAPAALELNTLQTK
ncbi:MAG: tyrosine-protein phosphatase, partial [Deltaproteobacteria bacterium]|nr:tyrosine-protein phosphatase [Deltaproteobacteria bacterium]